MADAADLVISAPHGGDLKPEINVIPDRDTSGPYCPSGCKTSKDSYTKEVSEVSNDIVNVNLPATQLITSHLFNQFVSQYIATPREVH